MTCGAWSWWPRDLLSRGERRSRELEVMRHLHGDGDDVHVSAVHKVLGVIDRERHAEAPAGGLGGFAPAGGQRRDLEVFRERLQGRDVRLRRPATIRIGTDDADADSLAHDALLNM